MNTTHSNKLALTVLCLAALSATDHCRAQDIAAASGVGSNSVAAVATVETTATVIEIDSASNSITLQGPRGRVARIAVNPDVADVSKLQIGDVVNIAYQNALLVHADKVRSNGIRERIDETSILPASGGVAASAHRMRVLATITKIDTAKRRITIRGPSTTETFDVAPDVPLGGLKVGDSIRAEFVSAVAAQVTRDGAPLK